jgi:type VI secretion system secreted protein Hcp
MAASEISVNLDGVKGENKRKGVEGQIKAHTVSWQIENGTNPTIAGGGGQGKPVAGNLIFTHNYDKASPTLAKFCASGKHIANAKITLTKSGEGQKEYLTITLKQVMVAHVSHTCDEGAEMKEEVHLSFADIEHSYCSQAESGELEGAVKWGLDLRTLETR